MFVEISGSTTNPFERTCRRIVPLMLKLSSPTLTESSLAMIPSPNGRSKGCLGFRLTWRWHKLVGIPLYPSRFLTLTAPSVRWDLWTWQDLQPNTGPGAAFYQFCDALEVKNGVSASENGWGVDDALSAWARWFSINYAADTGE